MENFPSGNTYTFSQEERDATERNIEADYAKAGRLEEYRLSKQLAEIERQKMKLEHELTIARQERERRERIARFEEKQRDGEEASTGAKLLYEIDKELESELKKTQEDYDREEQKELGRRAMGATRKPMLTAEFLQKELEAELKKTQEDYDREKQ